MFLPVMFMNLTTTIKSKTLPHIVFNRNNKLAVEQDNIEKKVDRRSARPFSQNCFYGIKTNLKVVTKLKLVTILTTDKRKIYHLVSKLRGCNLGAEISFGKGRERICLVVPIRAIEDDPDLTDKKSWKIPQNLTGRPNHLRLLGKLQFGKDTQPNKLKLGKSTLKNLTDKKITY